MISVHNGLTKKERSTSFIGLYRIFWLVSWKKMYAPYAISITQLLNLESASSDLPKCNSVRVTWRTAGNKRPITAIKSNPEFIAAEGYQNIGK